MPVYARDKCRNHYGILIRKNPNRSPIAAHNTSGYRGVTKALDWNGWIVHIRAPTGKQEYLGSYKSAEMAARAYDTAARKYFGAHARLNFPDEHIDVVKQGKQGKSGERHVSWETQRQRWIVRVTRNGQRVFVGSFLELDEAIKARNAAERDVH